MTPTDEIINVVVAGLGGQGVVKASDILAEVSFLAGFDVKKSEIHGMSQRGGSVSSDVRIGRHVNSPMVPLGRADYLILTDTTQLLPNRYRLRVGGMLITPDHVPFIADCEEGETSVKRKTLNVALLGILSTQLPIDLAHWLTALRNHVPPKYYELNVRTFLTAHAVERLMVHTDRRMAESGGRL